MTAAAFADALLATPEIERHSEIVKSFSAHFGNIEWRDADRVERFITEDTPQLVAQDEAYQNVQAKYERVNARVESDRGFSQVMMRLLTDGTQRFKEFQDNESFKRWLAEAMFNATCRKSASAPRQLRKLSSSVRHCRTSDAESTETTMAHRRSSSPGRRWRL